jgi:hypothetical protein
MKALESDGADPAVLSAALTSPIPIPALDADMRVRVVERCLGSEFVRAEAEDKEAIATGRSRVTFRRDGGGDRCADREGGVMAKSVATPSADYDEHFQRLDLQRTLMGGTRAMRRAGTRYLPQEQAEENAAYAARLARSTLFNAYRKTVEKMTGKVFAKPIAISGRGLAQP